MTYVKAWQKLRVLVSRVLKYDQTLTHEERDYNELLAFLQVGLPRKATP